MKHCKVPSTRTMASTHPAHFHNRCSLAGSARGSNANLLRALSAMPNRLCDVVVNEQTHGVRGQEHSRMNVGPHPTLLSILRGGPGPRLLPDWVVADSYAQTDGRTIVAALNDIVPARNAQYSIYYCGGTYHACDITMLN